MIRLILALLLLLAAPARAEIPCGPDSPCEIPGGTYHLLPPEGWDGTSPLPVLLWFHGHRSSGASVFRAGSIRSEFAARGWLVVAPDGAVRPGSDIRAWPARPGAGPRDDVAFALAVLDDVAARLPVDPGRVHVAGFSAGGSMAWMMACHAGERFAGVASVAGALRRPAPDDLCPSGPVPLLQIHGFSDTQVPLEGRGIGDWHQGDVWQSLDLIRRTNGCRSNPDGIVLGEDAWCRDWTSCDAAPVRMCLHPGGHGLPKGWAALVRAWFEAAD